MKGSPPRLLCRVKLLVGADGIRSKVRRTIGVTGEPAPVGMTLLGHEPGEGLTVVPLTGMPPSRVVVARRTGDTDPLVRSFVRTATAAYRN